MDGMKAKMYKMRNVNNSHSKQMTPRKPILSSKQAGFTLIEVMVVVLILAVLATFVAPKFLGKPEEARITRVKADIKAIKTSLDLYRLDNFSYPTTGDGLKALVTKPASAPDNWKQYLDEEPVDPWGNPYKYTNPGTRGGEIDIYSLGPDRVPGNDDIGNWSKGKE